MGGQFNIVDEFLVDIDTKIIGNPQITGSLFVTNEFEASGISGSFSGSGRDLFDIPLSALSEDLPPQSLISTGSVTASLSPDFRFQMNATASITGGLIVKGNSYVTGGFVVSSSIIEVPFVTGSDDIINVAFSSDSSSYNVNGVDGGPTLTLIRGNEYTFNVDTPNYNFFIKDSLVGGIGFTYNDGVTNNGEDSGSIIFDIPFDAPNTLYYISQQSASLSGSLILVDTLDKQYPIEFIGNTNITGSFGVSDTIITDKVIANEFSGAFSGSGRDLFDIPLSALSEDATLIASGSVTASVQDGERFKVITAKKGNLPGAEFTGSVDVSGSVTAFTYFGDGSNLSGVIAERAEDTPLITTGSVTASLSADGFFRIENLGTSNSGSVKSEFSGSVDISGSLDVVGDVTIAGTYTGDGSGLTNISIANISFDADRIASGSVTASVSPNEGFKVSGTTVAQFSSSLYVSESVTAKRFIGDGTFLTNVTAEASPRIASGSATASVSPNKGFVVDSYVSGAQYMSQFTGSVSITGSISASLFEGATLLTQVGSGTSLSYSTTTSGSHTYKLEYTASSPLDGTIYTSSDNVSGTLSKSK